MEFQRQEFFNAASQCISTRPTTLKKSSMQTREDVEAAAGNTEPYQQKPTRRQLRRKPTRLAFSTVSNSSPNQVLDPDRIHLNQLILCMTAESPRDCGSNISALRPSGGVGKIDCVPGSTSEEPHILMDLSRENNTCGDQYKAHI